MTDFAPLSRSRSQKTYSGSDRLISGFKSNLQFEVLQSGSVELESPNLVGTSTGVSITHNLGYQPLVMAFVAFSPTGTRLPLPYLSPVLPTTGTIAYQISFEVVGNDIISFYHRDIAEASNTTDYIQYYILKESASP